MDEQVLGVELALRCKRGKYTCLLNSERDPVVKFSEAGSSNSRIGYHFGRSDVVVVPSSEQWFIEGLVGWL